MKNGSLKQSILQTAAKLFVEKGVEGTSMNEIASALGITRTSIYYYFDNKGEILKSLTLDISILARELTTTIVGKPELDPPAMLGSLVRAYAGFIASEPVLFRVSERNESNLNEADRRASTEARRTVLENFRNVIVSGIDTGQFRPVDPSVTAFAIIGMCNWSAWWFQSSGKHDAWHLADLLADLAVHSIAQSRTHVLSRQTPESMIKIIRDELNVLEQSISEQRDGVVRNRASSVIDDPTSEVGSGSRR